jgi:hypothetical protein
MDGPRICAVPQTSHSHSFGSSGLTSNGTSPSHDGERRNSGGWSHSRHSRRRRR